MGTPVKLIVAGMTGALAGGTVKPASAPFEGAANVFRERIEARLRTVIEKTERKKGAPIDAVDDRVAVKVLTEAAFTDNAFVHEYLAGVLAGATPDNDGVHLLALVGRLTPPQLRLHFILYRAFD